MPGRCSGHRLRLVFISPTLLSIACVQAQRNLFSPLPRKDIELIAD
jgi:hypothetical protein